MSNNPYGNLYLYQEQRKLEDENDKHRGLILAILKFPLVGYEKVEELQNKIAFNEKQIQEIKDFLSPHIEEVKPKKKGFYLSLLVWAKKKLSKPQKEDDNLYLLERKEITAKWVEENNVKNGDVVRVRINLDTQLKNHPFPPIRDCGKDCLCRVVEIDTYCVGVIPLDQYKYPNIHYHNVERLEKQNPRKDKLDTICKELAEMSDEEFEKNVQKLLKFIRGKK
jgi:hypothetical protein